MIWRFGENLSFKMIYGMPGDEKKKIVLMKPDLRKTINHVKCTIDGTPGVNRLKVVFVLVPF